MPAEREEEETAKRRKEEREERRKEKSERQKSLWLWPSSLQEVEEGICISACLCCFSQKKCLLQREREGSLIMSSLAEGSLRAYS